MTPEALRQVVARTLPRSARVAVLAQPGEQVLPPEVPTPPPPEAAKRTAGHGEAINADEPWRRSRPAQGPARPLALPAGDRFALPNGLTVVRVARPGVPLVSAALVLRAGQDANPPDRPGLAGFTAALLEDGTQTRSATEFAEQVADLGATLAAKAGREDARIEFAGLRSGLADGPRPGGRRGPQPGLRPGRDRAAPRRRHAALLQQREDARATAATVAQRAWYGEGHPLGGQPARRRGGARGHHARRPRALLALALPAGPRRAGGGRRHGRRRAAHAGRRACSAAGSPPRPRRPVRGAEPRPTARGWCSSTSPARRRPRWRWSARPARGRPGWARPR